MNATPSWRKWGRAQITNICILCDVVRVLTCVCVCRRVGRYANKGVDVDRFISIVWINCLDLRRTFFLSSDKKKNDEEFINAKCVVFLKKKEVAALLCDV